MVPRRFERIVPARPRRLPTPSWSEVLGFTGLGKSWEASTRTRNHQMHGEVGQWMYEELAGIQALVHVPAANAGAVNEVGTGRSLDADKAPHVRLVSQEGDTVVYEIGSGSCSFRVTEPVSFDALTERFDQLVADGTVPAAAVAGLRDRLVRAEAGATAGDEAAALSYLSQFIARVDGSVRSAAARDQLVSLAREAVSALEANDEREDAPPSGAAPAA